MLLQVRPSDVRVPGTARFKLRLADPAAATKRHGPALATRLTTFISSVSQITEGLTETEKIELAGIPGLDPGELLLVAMACREDDALIVTGDKNALRTLANDPRCAARASKLAGRVVCLEQVLFDLMKLHGFDWLWTRVQASPGADRGVSMVVAQGMGASTTCWRAASGLILRDPHRAARYSRGHALPHLRGPSRRRARATAREGSGGLRT